MNPVLHLSILIAVAVAVSVALSWLLARSLAQSRLAPLDQPGPRSSHGQATPRAGGLGIVLVGLLSMLALIWAGAWPVRWQWTLLPLTAVALIGLLDDWRPRPAGLRLAVHALAAAALAWSALEGAVGLRWDWPLAIAAAVAIVWSINLHNFMDGIDGLLAWQGIWYGLVFAVLLGMAGEYGSAAFSLLLAAATIGFLPLNWPRARIFLGDGASGFIGAAFAWLALFAIVQGLVGLSACLIIASAFLVDASATLLVRLSRGERVWLAHREHLYQRLVRAGSSHRRVSLLYLAWNVIVALPALALCRWLPEEQRAAVAAAVLVLALMVWLPAWSASGRRLRPSGAR